MTDPNQAKGYAQVASMLASAQFRHSEQGIRQHNELAALTGRKMSRGLQGTAANFVQSASWLQNEAHQFGDTTRSVGGLPALITDGRDNKNQVKGSEDTGYWSPHWKN